MKLSELTKQQSALRKIEELDEDRKALATLLHYIDAGEGASVETDSSYSHTLRPASVPLIRQAIEQSLSIVEGELRALGVEIDEPAYADEDEAQS